MNQQTPLRTPPKQAPQPSPASAPQQSNTFLARLLLILLAASIAVIIGCVILIGVVLPGRNGDKKEADNSSNLPASGEVGQPDTDRGAVATVPSRTDYDIPKAGTYESIKGVSSKYAILVDLDSYEAIAGKNADTEICPASMTKVMTILVVSERLKSLDDRLTITAEILDDSLSGGGSGLKNLWVEGNEFSVEDLMYLAFMQSDTVACKLLANYVAGNEEEFTRLMNEKAREIGMDDTVFANSTGLSIKGETYHSTCRDIAMLMAYSLENPLAERVLTATDWVLKKRYAPIGERTTIKPTWLTERLGVAELETVTVKGGKTGWEDAPGACLVTYATANEGGGEYILVTVGGDRLSAKKSTADVKQIYSTYVN